jgi:DNA-binding NarL/FixJ family response regulator
MIRILIADDHAIVRKGINQILSEGFPDAEIDEVANAEAMISKIMESEWDVIISDLSMPGRSGLEAIPQIKQIDPKLPVLIMSIHSEDHYAIRVLKAGGSGYLSKDLAPDELVTAVKRVLTGKKYITSNVAEKLASMVDKDDDKPLHQMLSDREFTVLQLLGSGKSLSEIAESMILSINTVSTYRSRILVKMNLKNNTDITLYCIENKLM